MTNSNIDFLIREYAKMTQSTEVEVKQLILDKDNRTMDNLFKLACICEATMKGAE